MKKTETYIKSNCTNCKEFKNLEMKISLFSENRVKYHSGNICCIVSSELVISFTRF